MRIAFGSTPASTRRCAAAVPASGSAAIRASLQDLEVLRHAAPQVTGG
jgi:hypothetical protein